MFTVSRYSDTTGDVAGNQLVRLGCGFANALHKIIKPKSAFAPSENLDISGEARLTLINIGVRSQFFLILEKTVI